MPGEKEQQGRGRRATSDAKGKTKKEREDWRSDSAGYGCKWDHLRESRETPHMPTSFMWDYAGSRHNLGGCPRRPHIPLMLIA
jgi:hypothetical protein